MIHRGENVLGFPRERRLRKDQLKRVLREGGRTGRGRLRVLHLSEPGSGKKAGFVVRGSRNSSVTRNRYKRLLREIYRLNQDSIRQDEWLVLILQKPESEAGFFDLEKEFLTICRKAGILEK